MLSSTGTLTLGSTLGVSGTGNNIPTGSTVSVAGTTTINDGAAFSVNGAMQGAGAVNLVAATVNSTLSGTGSIANAVTLAGNNTLSSTGTLTLGGTLGVSGAGNIIPLGSTISITGITTASSGGTLRVNGTLNGTGTTSVAGTLRGTGTVRQAASLTGSGVIIAPASPATLTLGSLSLVTGSSSSFTLDPSYAGNTTAMVTVTGGLTATGVHTLSFSTVNGTPALGSIYELYSFTGTPPAASDFVPASGSPSTYQIQVNSGQVDLKIALPNGGALEREQFHRTSLEQHDELVRGRISQRRWTNGDVRQRHDRSRRRQ